MRKFLHDYVDPGVLLLTPFAPCLPHSMALGSPFLPAVPDFRLSKASLHGSYLQSTSLNRLARVSLMNAVCATAPSFTCLSQI